MWNNISRGGQRGHFWFAGENPVTIQNTSSIPRANFKNLAAIQYYAKDTTANLILHISKNGGGPKRIDTQQNKGCVQRYLWDLEFESLLYTDEQTARANAIWDNLLANTSSNTVCRYYRNFQNAETPRAKRRAIGRLATGYLSMDIPQDLLIPKAGLGVY